MNDPSEVKTQGDILFSFFTRLYGERFSPEMQNDLRAAMEAVSKTVVALRSVPIHQYGDPSLWFAPFRKEG